MTEKNTKIAADTSVRKGQKASQLSTQRYLQFAEVHDDVLVLKNGGLRAVLEVNSINFNLKSEDEQEAIIRGYQGFLNALNFPTQILVRSRKLDIDQYLDSLRKREKKIENELLRTQMGEYIEYVQKLVEYADIMEKRFFVVVPLDPARAAKKGAFGSFLEYIQPDDTVMKVLQRKREFKNLKKELDSRIGTVTTALGNCGLTIKRMTTEEVIKLFYQAYNPDMSRTQKFNSMDDLMVEGTPSENITVNEK